MPAGALSRLQIEEQSSGDQLYDEQMNETLAGEKKENRMKNWWRRTKIPVKCHVSSMLLLQHGEGLFWQGHTLQSEQQKVREI